MDEIANNNNLELELSNGTKILGRVVDYTKDRIFVLIDKRTMEAARNINELEKLYVVAQTKFGIKHMFSHVISTIDKENCLTIENAPTLQCEQKRETVRAVDDFNFKIQVNGIKYDANCLNLSAGGIAFQSKKDICSADQIIDMIFDERIFSRQIICKAKIISASIDSYTAEFVNLNIHDESRITKRVFMQLARK